MTNFGKRSAERPSKSPMKNLILVTFRVNFYAHWFSFPLCILTDQARKANRFHHYSLPTSNSSGNPCFKLRTNCFRPVELASIARDLTIKTCSLSTRLGLDSQRCTLYVNVLISFFLLGFDQRMGEYPSVILPCRNFYQAIQLALQ